PESRARARPAAAGPSSSRGSTIAASRFVSTGGQQATPAAASAARCTTVLTATSLAERASVRQERHRQVGRSAEQHGACDRRRSETLADLVQRGVKQRRVVAI